NGMVRFADEKMSKSVGNIRSLGDALDEAGPQTLVMYFVSGHYRQPIVYSAAQLDQARAQVARVRDLVRRLDADVAPSPPPEGFTQALADDFNTPAALAELFGWIGDANRRLDAGESVDAGPLREMLWLLGLESLLDPDGDAPDAEAEQLLEERESARAAKDFATADARRDRLRELGWEVRDTPEGPKLVRP
ncbi:MAG TPA: DALR domain-containing protein, partial [Thermoleophilaceae bacterium]